MAWNRLRPPMTGVASPSACASFGIALACVVTAVVLATAPCRAAEATGWPQWRGPGGQGHANDAHDLPVEWSETKNVAWKTPLPGRGWSSPVIEGGMIWMTTAVTTPLDEAKLPISV